MYWYKFYTYFRLPLGLLNCFGNILIFLLNNLENLTECIVSIISFIYMAYLLYVMHKKKKNGFTFIFINLLLETLYMIIYSISNKNVGLGDFIIYVLIYFSVWFLPNYIYFKKRKDIFVN